MDPATILVAGGVALAFLLFGGKKRRRGAAPGAVQPDVVEPIDQPPPEEPPQAPPKKPGTQTVPPLPGGATQFPSPNEKLNAITMFHTRPRKVMGHTIDPYSLDNLASAAFWLSYPALGKLPGGKLPALQSVAPGHEAAWATYAEAWKRIRAMIGGLHNEYRSQIFFSTPDCRIVVVGRDYLETVKSSIAGLATLQPASQIADMLVDGEANRQFGKPCPETFTVRTAKKGIAQKIIDRYGGHP